MHFFSRPLQALLPVFRKGKAVCVTRCADVQTVLRDDKTFAVAFRPRMAELDRTGAVSVLGMADDADYEPELIRVMGSLRLDDHREIGDCCAEQAIDVVRNAATQLDAVGTLLAPVSLRAAERYFGLAPKRREDLFALWRWSMVLSEYTLGGEPPAGLHEAARAAGALMDAELDTRIAQLKLRPDHTTVLGRLLLMQRKTGSPSDDQIRAIVAGLLTGMLPNMPFGGRNVLEVLLRRPDAMAASCGAAEAGDDALLGRCIWEALRLYPLTTGRSRTCIAKGGASIGPRRVFRGPVHVAEGEQVEAWTLTAMFDRRAVAEPGKFNPDRPASDSMAFGYGKHWCVGAPLAITILTQTLKPLLLRKNLRRKPGSNATYFLDYFPTTFMVEFDAQP